MINLDITYDAGKDIYTIKGKFGAGLLNYFKESLTVKRLNLLFIVFRSTEIKIHSFFLLELYSVLENLTNEGVVYGVNFENVSGLMKMIKEETWVSGMINPRKVSDNEIDMDRVKSIFKFTPLKHQESIYKDYILIKDGHGFNGFILNSPAGSGKTYMGLSLCESRHADLVIIIAPLNTLDTVWVKSITKSLYKEPQSYYKIGDKLPYNNQKFIISSDSDSSIRKIIELADKLNYSPYIIVDESHNFIDENSNRTEELSKLVEAVEPSDVILSSGTPIKGKLKELIPIFKILDNKFNNIVAKKFEAIYKRPNALLAELLQNRFQSYTSIIEHYEEKDIDKKVLRVTMPTSDKYTLESISKDMKEYLSNRTIELANTETSNMQEYNRLLNKAKEVVISTSEAGEADFSIYTRKVNEIRDAHDRGRLNTVKDSTAETNVFEKRIIEPALVGDDRKAFRKLKGIIKYPTLVIQGEILGKVVLRARINCHVDMAKHIPYQKVVDSAIKKTIIFSNYVEVCETAFDKCTLATKTNPEGLNPVGVYGKYTKDVNKSVQVFTDDKDINPMITTYKSLSTGVPLVAANLALLIDTPFRELTLTQTLARIARQGQDTKCLAYICRLDTGDKKNINDRNIDIITWYKKEVENITGIPSTTDLTVFEEDSEELVKFDVDVESIKYDNLRCNYDLEVPINSQKSVLDKWK